MALCKDPRNPVNHVVLLFAQNSVPGDTEHIAGRSDLPRNLGEGSSASNMGALPQTMLQLGLFFASQEEVFQAQEATASPWQ